MRKVPLYHKLHHHLIVLQRRYIGDNQPNDFASRLLSTQIGFGTHHKVRGVTIYENVNQNHFRLRFGTYHKGRPY